MTTSASIPAFFDELGKIAVELTNKEKRRQAVEFGVLGAVSAPAIAAVTNKIEKGTFIPKDVPKGRWLGARLAGGALASGALPIIRHHIEQRNLAKAKARVRGERG